MYSITKEEARNFLISYHNLDDSQALLGEEGILTYLKRVGCIQYDPLNVVGRNPDLVLQSKIKGYKKEMLESLLYEKRSLVDGWDKMMAIYPTEDWPYFERIRKAKEIEVKSTLRNRNSIDALELIDELKETIKQKGPMQSNDFNVKAENTGSWGHRKLSSAALDYMFNTGILGVYKKRNTQKIYDLMENLIDPSLLNQENPIKMDEEFYKWYVKRRIGSVGLLWDRNGGGWLGHFIQDSKIRKNAIKELLEEDEIVPFQIEDLKETFYIRKEDQGYLNQKVKGEQVKFLAPLDNLLWDRLMIEKLFNFSYTWEVYVPEVKRKYGYYVLPILYKNKLIGRFEPELHRNHEPLKIKKLWFEEPISSDIKDSIITGFQEFSQYLEASDVKINKRLWNASK